MIIIDFTEAKLRNLAQEFIKKGNEYGGWAMEGLLQMYLEKEIDIRWEGGFPIPDVILTDDTRN